MSKSAVQVALEALAAGRAALPEFGSRTSRRDTTQPQLFASLVLRQFLQTDYQGVVITIAEWSKLRRALGLTKVALLDARPRLAPHPGGRGGWGAFIGIQAGVVRRARRHGLIDAAPVVAVDTTGLETRHISARFGQKRAKGKAIKGGGHRQRAWPKLTVLPTHSHLLLGAVPGIGSTQDSPDFTPAMCQAAGLLAIDVAPGDAGYDAEHNHRLCREDLGIRQALIRLNHRNTGRRWPKTPYRRAMRHCFPKPLYHRRRHVESGFSQHKRRLGSALTARNIASQNCELVLRVFTHNVAILAETA